MKFSGIKFLQGTLFVGLLALASCGGGDDRPAVEFFRSNLSGAQEVPPNASAASASGTVSVEPDTLRMQAAATVASGISPVAAHIHQGAVGVSGPIIFPLSETFAGSGVWSTDTTLTEAQLATLRSGNYYFNMHSTAFPGGEIRGQILMP